MKRTIDNGTLDHWYKLVDGVDGVVHLRAAYIPITQRLRGHQRLVVPRNPVESHAIVVILIYDIAMSHHCEPIVVFEVSGREPVITSPGHLSQNWEYVEEFYVPVNNIAKDKVTISMMDYQQGRDNLIWRTGRTIKAVSRFIAESSQSQKAPTFDRSHHRLLGETTVPFSAFTGLRQLIPLRSEKGGTYDITLIGRVFPLKEILTEDISTGIEHVSINPDIERQRYRFHE